MILTIIFLPLITSVFAGLTGNLIGSKGARFITIIGMITNLYLSIVLLLQNLYQPVISNIHLGTWVASELFHLDWGFNFDALTLTMFLVVNLISCLVHIYSSSYMAEDPHIPRFMSYISLFTFFMLILVTADYFAILFIGWEGVGICSYLLIAFWYTRIQANKSAIKALIVNRIGDVALTLGMITVFCTMRNLEFPALFALAPFFKDQTSGFGTIITVITILLLLGAMGKSAQIFLHTWLPDAMEGPTPVSALIHAATMVTAGVFLIIKCSPIFEYSELSLVLLATVGGLTAIFSSTVGMVQYDIKKVIAYSTCSQLGYMMFACGLSTYQVSLFHLMNHAVFKALLFLSAGAVIHSLANEQDMRRMGGLTKLLPFVYICITIGSLALMGIPFLTGYYSKDVILEIAYSQYNVHGSFIHWLGTITAFFTAFYSLRLIYLSFIREPQLTKTTANQAHESPIGITIPLTILAIGSIFVGYLFKDLFIGVGTPFLDDSIFTLPKRNFFFMAEFLPSYIKNLPLLLSLISIFTVYLVYFLIQRYNLMYLYFTRDVHRFLLNKWNFDLIYNKYVNQPLLTFGYNVLFKLVDKGVVEIFGPYGIYKLVNLFSKLNKYLQTGRVYNYVAYILTFVLFIYVLLEI